VPPQQCPACGRFLKRTLVESLTDEPTPCPGCGEGLVASMFTPEPPGVAAAAGGRDDAPPSVRPPDLEPETVRDAPSDVLAGWDAGGEVVDLDRWREDRPPFPVDAAVVGGAVAVGALVGALADDRRGRGAMLGALGGGLVAAVVRQVWRLED
jgi:hypothetical protein